jgi:hypothetical protein
MNPPTIKPAVVAMIQSSRQSTISLPATRLTGRRGRAVCI